jgi:hypothetical protein
MKGGSDRRRRPKGPNVNNEILQFIMQRAAHGKVDLVIYTGIIFIHPITFLFYSAILE